MNKAQLIEKMELALFRGHDGSADLTDILVLLRDFDVLQFKDEILVPLFFEDAWVEVFDKLIKETGKIG